MKLRNKKTGEIADLSEGFIKDTYNGEFIQIKPVAISNKEGYLYDSLAKLNEDWEDYKPAEPLIKDEKTRKAVRAWAELNSVQSVTYDEVHQDRGLNVYLFEDNEDENAIIQGYGWIPTLEEGEDYTIAELCGEEE